MNSGRWVEVPESDEYKRPGWISPGLLLGVAFGVLILVVIVGVLISRRSDGEGVRNDLTIAELRSDPAGYNGAEVELVGTISNRYALPLLDQYALYEIDDGTGSMFVLSDKGAPPGNTDPVRITAIFNGAVELDDQLRQLIEDQLGSAAAFIADQLLPGVPLNVLYLTHQKFEPAQAGESLAPSFMLAGWLLKAPPQP